MNHAHVDVHEALRPGLYTCFVVADRHKHYTLLHPCGHVTLQYFSKTHEGSVIHMIITSPVSHPAVVLVVFSQQIWAFMVNWIRDMLPFIIQKLLQGSLERRHGRRLNVWVMCSDSGNVAIQEIQSHSAYQSQGLQATCAGLCRERATQT